MEVRDFISLGSKITAYGNCSHGIKRHLYLGRKAMTNLDSILKSRDIMLWTKAHIVKAMVFPVVMYRCESWTINKAEHSRTDGFELWRWRRLESPLACKQIQAVHPKGDQSPKLWATWCEELIHWKNPDAGKDWRWEEKGTTEDEMVGWHHQPDGHEFK